MFLNLRREACYLERAELVLELAVKTKINQARLISSIDRQTLRL